MTPLENVVFAMHLYRSYSCNGFTLLALAGLSAKVLLQVARIHQLAAVRTWLFCIYDSG
jgi:hypothetical protein